MDADDTWKLCLSSGMAWILYTSIIPSPFSSVNASLARLLLNNLPHPANLAVRQHDLDTMRVEAALCEQPLYNALSQLTRALVCLQHDFDPRRPSHRLCSVRSSVSPIRSPVLADIAEYVRNGSFDLIGDLLRFRLCNANVLRYGENILSGRIAAIAVYAGGMLAAQRIAVS